MKKKFVSLFLAFMVLFAFSVPSSNLILAEEPDLSQDYTLLDWEPVGNSYWMSTEPNLYNQLINISNKPTANNLGMFVSSGRMFTREDIPVGSYIQIDSGYQYRPEQWTQDQSRQETRPGNVTSAQVYVDEEWWGDSAYKAFNISAVNGSQIGNMVDEIKNIFRIYVPNSGETVSTPLPTQTAAPTQKPDESGDDGVLKILAIGNSFSEDALTYLYTIARKSGFEHVVLGNCFISGGTMEQHWNNVLSGTKCTFQKRDDTGSQNLSRTLQSCIENENWDVITLQQGSGSSGMPDTYEPYLTQLLDYVDEYKTNPDAKIGWHMTWAYQQDSTHNEFPKYDSDQMTMYNAIVKTVQDKVIPTDRFDFIIPSGTAVQNMRTSYIGDNLTRDGYHMSKVLGRYVVGLTWFRAVTGLSVDELEWIPDPNGNDQVTPAAESAAKEAVNKAIAVPFSVTKSSFNGEYPYTVSQPAVSGSSVTAKFTKTADTAGSDWFVIAVYDESGALISLETAEESLQTYSEKEISLSGELKTGWCAKAFVFDSFETLAPLGKSSVS